jgi:hypothetical protein
MSFYTLEMEASAEPMQVLQFLAQHLPFEWQDCKSASPSYAPKLLVGGQTNIFALTRGEPSFGASRQLGFTAHLVVHMEVFLPSEEVHKEAVRTVMQCTTVLLKHLQGDAVLTFYNEVLMLQRLKGELVLNAAAFCADYARQALPEITLPYEMREMPLRL